MRVGTYLEDGRVFVGWWKPGVMRTLTSESYHRACISRTRIHAKNRAEAKDLPFDISIEYLMEIFPDDWMCPILEIPLSWGLDRQTSPSLDRILPSQGYVQDNVQWISGMANSMKLNATPEQLVKFSEYMLNLYGE